MIIDTHFHAFPRSFSNLCPKRRTIRGAPDFMPSIIANIST